MYYDPHYDPQRQQAEFQRQIRQAEIDRQHAENDTNIPRPSDGPLTPLRYVLRILVVVVVLLIVAVILGRWILALYPLHH
jgi:hypothetical protein